MESKTEQTEPKSIQENQAGENIQPFPALPSFPVAGTILSFYGQRNQVKTLLMRLNHRSGAYFVKHLPQIAGFVPFPTITPSETYFGS